MRGFARLLQIDVREASPVARGFEVRDETRGRLEAIGQAFLRGYNSALRVPTTEVVQDSAGTDAPDRGFVLEGAAMACGILDGLLPWSRRVTQLLEAADDHVYMLHVGAGWALARLPWGRQRVLGQLAPLLRPLAFDGLGFHDGYFRWPTSVNEQARPDWLRGYELRAFDQGLGRSLWFVKGADVSGVATAIMTFPEERRPDLWSGVGLACGYAGGVARSDLERLAELASCWRDHVAQGVAFAAKARERAGIPTAHTEMACQVLCGLPASACASVTDSALAGIDTSDASGAAYEKWRARLRQTIGRERELRDES